MRVYFRLLEYLRPYVWPYFCVAMVCMLAYGATDGFLPFLVRGLYDDIFAAKNEAALALMPILVVVVFIFRGTVNFGQRYLTDYVGLRVVTDLRHAINARLQWLSLDYFHQNPTGTLLSRVTSDVMLVRSALTGAVASFIRDTTSVVVLTGVAFFMDWVLACIAFVAFPVSVFPVSRLSKKIKRSTKRGQVSTGTLTTLLQESIQGSRIVKAFGMEHFEISRFDNENHRLLRQLLRASRSKALVEPAMELVGAFGVGAVLWYAGSSVIAGTRTPGQFTAFMTAMFLMYQPFKRLTKAMPAIYQGIAGGERLFEVLDAPMTVTDSPTAIPAPPLRQSIEFRGVHFSYGSRPVLEDIHLTIRCGEIVALVGVSGAGKSTLADLIPRYYDVSSGSILLDGTDIRSVTLASLRNQISVVTQHTFLFNASVRDNIAYGDPAKKVEDIVRAAEAANAHGFIQQLPEGYDTMIGELGMKLSGGQRQRLAIARAILKDAPILILDEATSSLDSDSEKLVQDALEKLMSHRTTLVIAHRLSTIRKADRIVVLVNGRIVEQGTHEELLKRKTEYSRLYSLQFFDESGPMDKLLH